MNDNKETIQESAADDFSSTVATMQEPQPKKNSGGSKKLITGLLVCAVAAVCIFAAKTFLIPNPEAVVKKAFTATVAEQKAVAEDIYAKIPAAKKLFEYSSPEPSSTDFDFTLKSLEFDNGDPSSAVQVALVNALVSESGIKGNTISDPKAGIFAFNGSAYLKGTDLVDLELYTSPELIAGRIPKFSETTVSILPNTIAQDYKNSVLNSMMPMDDANLEILQNSITGQLEYIKAMGNISTEKLLSDISGILAKSLDNATYEYDSKAKTYVVKLAGADVKAAIIGYYRYIYLDSEIATAMEATLAPTLALDGESYADAMELMLSEIEGAMPDMETVINLTVANKKISKANIVCTPAPQQADKAATDMSFDSIVIDCALNGAASNVSVAMNMTAASEPIAMKVDVSANLQNDVYGMNMNIAVDAASVKFSMPLEMSIAANGAFVCKTDLTVDAEGEKVNAAFASNGTATLENNVFKFAIPASVAEFSVTGAQTGNISGKLTFDYTGESKPITEAISAPQNAKSVLAMSMEELTALSGEYYQGAMSLAAMFGA